MKFLNILFCCFLIVVVRPLSLYFYPHHHGCSLKEVKPCSVVAAPTCPTLRRHKPQRLRRRIRKCQTLHFCSNNNFSPSRAAGLSCSHQALSVLRPYPAWAPCFPCLQSQFLRSVCSGRHSNILVLTVWGIKMQFHSGHFYYPQ